MNLTAYSFIMAVLWCDIFIIILTLLRRRTTLLMQFGLFPVACLILTTLFRLFISIELPFTTVIHSDRFYPAVQNFFIYTLFSFGAYPIRVVTILLFVWFTVSAVLIFNFGRAWARYTNSVAGYPRETDPCVISILTRVIGKDKKQNLIEIAKAKGVSVPYVIGFFRPVIVMPDIEYSAEELEFIFAHEWQHFCNKDQWIKFLVYIICCVMWWNPLIYLLKNQLNQTLELRCDFAVLSKLPEDKRDLYYMTILQIYKKLNKNLDQDNIQEAPIYVPALTGVKTDSYIRQRFILGLNYGRIRKRKKLITVSLCCMILLTVLSSYLFVLQPAYHVPSEEDGTEIIAVLSQDSYLVNNMDGTYQLYMNGTDCGFITDISIEPFASLEIHKLK